MLRKETAGVRISGSNNSESQRIRDKKWLRARHANFQVCLKVTVLFLLFHTEARVGLLPLTKFSTAHSDPFNNSPIDFKLTRTRYRTEISPAVCERVSLRH